MKRSPPDDPFAERAGGRCAFLMSKRLSATDISALASMKNVAKCDTWCELQNPVNHRVFERKLRPKPLGRGHVCLGVTHRVAPPPAHRARDGGAETGLPCPSARLAQMRSLGDARHDQWWLISTRVLSCGAASSAVESTMTQRRIAPSTATPGQAGLPAEFKHINKRRKRNLQGFP